MVYDLVCAKGMGRVMPSLSSSLGTETTIIIQNVTGKIYRKTWYMLKTYYVVVQFYPQFKFYFPLFWGLVMYGNEFKTKGNKN